METKQFNYLTGIEDEQKRIVELAQSMLCFGYKEDGVCACHSGCYRLVTLIEKIVWED